MNSPLHFSTPVPLQPEFVDTLPPAPTRPRPALRPLTSARSCMQLGLCQAHQPACEGCTWAADRPRAAGHYFAPGAIEGMERRRTTPGARVARFLQHPTTILVLCLLLIGSWIASVAGFVLGFYNPIPRLVNWAAQMVSEWLPGWLP